jgi:Protein of unknown function (DUF3530)
MLVNRHEQTMKHFSSMNRFALLVILGLESVCVQAESAAASATEASSSSKAAEVLSEKQPYATTHERDNHLLMIAKPTEAQWLETPNEKIVVLYKAGETRKTKGILLILHTPESPQLWPAPLENLRVNLPVYGWASLAVPLPQKFRPDTKNNSTSSENSTNTPNTTSSENTTSSDNSVTTNNAKTFAPREQLIAERTQAAILDIHKKDLSDLAKNNLVVLVDNSAAADSLATLYKTVSTSTIKNKINGPLQALILVNLQEQEPLTQTQLTTIFSIAELPIMDVFFGSNDDTQLNLRRMHKAEAMRKNVAHYQQLVLPPEHPLNTSNKLNFWQEKVRGFMEKYTEIQK